MTIKRIKANQRMSNAVIHGDMIYLSGICAEGGTVTVQMQAILQEIDRLLNLAGSDKSKILSAQVWLSNMMLVDDMNAVWDEWIDVENPPARACVEARLVGPQWLVEVMITATSK